MLLLTKVCIFTNQLLMVNSTTIQFIFIFHFFLGTSDFLIKNPGFVEDQSLTDETLCNKDTGGLKTLQSWSRGIFFIVSAGGHIEYWQPLYRFVFFLSAVFSQKKSSLQNSVLDLIHTAL